MFISIAKTGSGRYVFCVGDDPNDDTHSWLTSYADSAVLGDIPPSFASFGEAHAAASRLVDERPSCVLAKKATFYSAPSDHDKKGIAEGEILAHYNEQIELIGHRLAFLQQATPKDFAIQLKRTSNEVQEVKDEIERLQPSADSQDGVRTFSKMLKKLDGFSRAIDKLNSTKTASESSPFSAGLPKTVIRAFSEAAMLAVKPLHEDVFVKGASFFPLTSTYESILATPQGDLVKLAFDKNLMLFGVLPCGQSLQECGGLHSGNFFVKYWEPVVNAVGHFHSRGHGIVASVAMDISKRNRMRAFSMQDNSEAFLSIERPVVMGRRTWFLEKTAAEVTNPPSTPIAVTNEVECTADYLPSYKGSTGFVSEVNTRPGRTTLYRVDFRRGLGIIWLEEQNVRKVNLGT